MAGPGLEIFQLEDENEEKTALQHIEQIKKQVKEAEKVDLAFLLDATGSMGPLIKGVKAKIVEIAEGVKGAFPEDGDLRIACAFYRDYDADEDAFYSEKHYERSGICCPFTRDVRVFQKEVEGLEAWGGDDDPEDVFSGLERLLDLEWTAPATRLVYHIADAPCHGRRFHDPQYAKQFEDKVFRSERFQSPVATSQDDPEGRKIENILRRLAMTAKISSYTFLHINKNKEQRPTTAKMLEEFRKANDSTTSGMNIDEHTVDVSANGRGSKAFEELSIRLLELVKNTVKNGVNSRINDLVNKPSTTKTFKKYVKMDVDDQIPSNLDTIDPCRVFCYRSTKCKTLDEMLTKIDQGSPLGFQVNKGGEPILVRIAQKPFSPACVTRWPYYAKFQLDSPSTSPVVVIKKFRYLDSDIVKDWLNPFNNPYLEVMETYAIASQFANQFHIELQNKKALDGIKKLHLDPPLTTCKVESTKECFTVETLHSNAQWIKVDERPEYYQTLQTFSHWTHVCSEGLLMVIVQTLILKEETPDKEPEAVLCDPTIHIKKYPRRFKRTNKGELGIEIFYSKHKCGVLCKVLGLEEII